MDVVVIDGWGIPSERSPKAGDAIAAAQTPVMDDFASSASATAQGYTELEASSLAVGLPEGLMGNSEVGHLNIGAGRVVWQDVSTILIDRHHRTHRGITGQPPMGALRWSGSTRS